MQSGRTQLRTWMKRSTLSQVETADKLGIDGSYVSLMVSGKRLPGRDLALRIERLTGIPVRAWQSSSLDSSSRRVTVEAVSA